MNKIDELKSRLESIKKDLESKGVYPKVGDWGAIKKYEIEFQDAIESVFDEIWWKVTGYWDIFDAFMGTSNTDEVIEELLKHIEPEYLGEDKIHVEEGHTLDEYMDKFGDAYRDGDLWDFDPEELKDGSIEPREDIVYWAIKDEDGELRYYETDISPKEESLEEKADLDKLAKEEDDAIKSYDNEIDKSEGKEKDLLKHIKSEEEEHKKELVNAKEGDFEPLDEGKKKKKDYIMHVNKNAGDPVKSMAMFNHMMGQDGGSVAGASEGACCEAVDGKDYNELFNEFLNIIEFELVKCDDTNRKTKSSWNDEENEGDWAIRDLQGANLGGIEEDRFNNATEIADRCDVYIADYFLGDEYDDLEDAIADSESGEKDILDMLAYHTNEVDLNKVYELQGGDSGEQGASVFELIFVNEKGEEVQGHPNYVLHCSDELANRLVDIMNKYPGRVGWSTKIAKLPSKDLASGDQRDVKVLEPDDVEEWAYKVEAEGKADEEWRNARVEYCVMKDGNNIECFDNEDEAIKFAQENGGDKVLEVSYGPKDENGDEPELGAFAIWEREEESLEEARGKGLVCKYKGFSIHDVGDTFVVTDEHGATVHQTKNGLPVIKAMIDDGDIKSKDGLKEADTGYDHYGAKDMEPFEGPAYIEYDGGPRQIEVLCKARNNRWVWKNEGGVSDEEWYKFPSYEEALKVQKQVGGEIRSWNEYMGIDDESLKEEVETPKVWKVTENTNNNNSDDVFSNVNELKDEYYDFYGVDNLPTRDAAVNYVKRQAKAWKVDLNSQELEKFEKGESDVVSGKIHQLKDDNRLVGYKIEQVNKKPEVHYFTDSLKEGVHPDNPWLKRAIAYLNRYPDAYAYICSYKNPHTHQDVGIAKGFRTKEEFDAYVRLLTKESKTPDISTLFQSNKQDYIDYLKDNKENR